MLSTKEIMVLLVACLAQGCLGQGGETETPEPVECVAIDFSGYCNNAGCVRDYACSGKPNLGPTVTCTLKSENIYTCRW